MTSAPVSAPDVPVAESYRRSGRHVIQQVTHGGRIIERKLKVPEGLALSPAGAFEVARLRECVKGQRLHGGKALLTVDAFSGCGGLSLGLHDAARMLGFRPAVTMALDTNPAAMSVFQANFRPTQIIEDPIETYFPGGLGAKLTLEERGIRRDLGERLDVLVGGPPCQGHSDLNNHSRRSDPKNALYERMARMAEVLQPRVLLIENVPGAVHDKTQIVQRTQAFLKELGYDVDQVALRSDDYGAAQRRRRHFTLATREGNIQGVLANLASLRQEPLNVLDAIQDLTNVTSDEVFDSSASHSPTNRRRIQYLFDRDIYELPDEERPDCHRLKPHSYQSVYGRLYPNEPAPTITSGFGSTGQGRFVHPLRPRTLTPHEAARLQGFPDSFSFADASSRVALQEMIGNAVPYRLAYSVCLALLGSLA